MNTYKTAEIAGKIGIHPNTVRLYEKLELIPKPAREANGYRVFTDFHLEQFKLARMAFKIEVLQNGLRKSAIEIIKTSAQGDFDRAIRLAEDYLQQIKVEQSNAEEAIFNAERLLSGTAPEQDNTFLTRKETSDYLQISMDVLRNWELNGLLTIKRRQNGYRVYSQEDLQRLKIIRSLRCANYSLAAILRMLCALSENPQADIRASINTPNEEEDIISVCDRLITSLEHAEENARSTLKKLRGMKKRFKINYPF